MAAVGAGGGLAGAGGGGVIWAAAASMGDSAMDELSRLNQVKRDLHRERQRVAKELKAAERKRQKLVNRASGLSDDDLLAILGARASAKAKAKAAAKGKGKAKAKAKGKSNAVADPAVDAEDE